MNASRSLSLHESALSPDEYTTYTELFHELVEPPDTVLAVREARGYLKGRYSGLETGTVDKVFTSQSLPEIWTYAIELFICQSLSPEAASVIHTSLVSFANEFPFLVDPSSVLSYTRRFRHIHPGSILCCPKIIKTRNIRPCSRSGSRIRSA
jgi:hypothetical protein